MNGAKTILLLFICVIFTVDTTIALRPLGHININVDPSLVHAKVVESICTNVTYKDVCNKWLGNVASNDPQVLVKSAFTITSDSLKSGYNFTENLLSKYNTKTAKRSIESCKDDVDSGLEIIKPLVEKVETVTDMADYLNKDYYNVRMTLTQVFTHYSNCFDDISDDGLTQELASGLNESKEFVSSVMAIVKYSSKIFKTFGIKCDVPEF